MKKTVHIITNIAPKYRQNLWEFLVSQKSNKYIFYFTQDHPLGITEMNFETPVFQKNSTQLKPLKSIWILNKILFWQKGIMGHVRKIAKNDTAIFFGDAYCLSNWISAIYLRLKGIKVVFWSHGLYGNEGTLKKMVRKTFYKLANAHLLYERRAKQILTAEGFNPDNLYVVFNSLDYDNQKLLFEESKNYKRSEVFSFFKDPELKTIVFIGRLTKVKKLEILLEAVQQINKDSILCNLLIVGDGSERKNLEDLGENGINNNWIHFTGTSFDEQHISKLISQAELCVSPGNVGLTSIHSLSFGTPVCSHDNFYEQMPEVESIEIGKNGVLFEQGNVADLIKKINWSFEHLPKNETTQKNCRKVIDEFYNPLYQMDVFNRLIEGQIPKV